MFIAEKKLQTAAKEATVWMVFCSILYFEAYSFLLVSSKICSVPLVTRTTKKNRVFCGLKTTTKAVRNRIEITEYVIFMLSDWKR
jgi:hypothetical protein